MRAISAQCDPTGLGLDVDGILGPVAVAQQIEHDEGCGPRAPSPGPAQAHAEAREQTDQGSSPASGEEVGVVGRHLEEVPVGEVVDLNLPEPDVAARPRRRELVSKRR